MDPTEVINLLFEDGGHESDDDSGGGAIGAPPSGRTVPAPVVNLKHGRGLVPDEARAAFRELCRQPKVDACSS